MKTIVLGREIGESIAKILKTPFVYEYHSLDIETGDGAVLYLPFTSFRKFIRDQKLDEKIVFYKIRGTEIFLLTRWGNLILKSKATFEELGGEVDG